uniref:Uncharacterized protein n=1 Tax=Vitis vinifera TaxID=29760 RepID=F6HMV5_VITVI
MAQEQVESQSVGPPDAQWMPIQTTDNEEMRSLGEFAVNEQNQKSDGGNLKLLVVAEAWQMSLAPDAGRIYLLHLFVSAPDGENPACSRHMFGRPLGVLGSSCPLSQLSSSCVAISLHV